MADTVRMETAAGKPFLAELFHRTAGDPAVQVSMHDVGAAVGLERADTSKTAEELIGLGLVEIKTLSGGIGITDEGVSAARRMGCGDGDGRGPETAALGDGPCLDAAAAHSVEKIVALLKTEAGEQSWEFEVLSELIADLKTVDAQMVSPRPKTAVIRECFLSMATVLEKVGNTESLERVRRLLG